MATIPCRDSTIVFFSPEVKPPAVYVISLAFLASFLCGLYFLLIRLKS